jgi:hypothetical protein
MALLGRTPACCCCRKTHDRVWIDADGRPQGLVLIRSDAGDPVGTYLCAACSREAAATWARRAASIKPPRRV